MSFAALFQEVENAFRPTGIQVREMEDRYLIEAVVAGVEPEKIDIEKKDRAIQVHAKSDPYQYNYLIPLDGLKLSADEPVAECRNGILKIVLMKARETKPLKISIKSSF